MNKSPAFQWYPKDVLASARVQEMSLAEEGAYRRLIDYCWLNGDVPADPQRCARLIGKGATEEIAKVVLEMFIPSPTNPDRMIHDRLEIERKKQEEHSKERSESGKRGAKTRWAKGVTGDSSAMAKPIAQKVAKHIAKNSSSSSSSSSELLAKHLGLLCECCELSTRTMGAPALSRLDNDLEEMRACGMDLLLLPDFRRWWNENDWRGKKGQAPTIANVRSEWAKFETRNGGHLAIVPPPKHKCATCQDTGSISVFENGDFSHYADCPNCQAQEAA